MWFRSFRVSWRKQPSQAPLIMGHEFTGEVVELGEGVAEFQQGDLVVVNPLISCGHCKMCKRGDQQNCSRRSIIGIHHPGAFAEYIKVPASACFPVRDALAGALVEPLACGIRAVEQAKVSLDDNVVVFGAGIIGLFSLKAASLRGAGQLILIDTNDERLERGKAFGATHTLNPKNVDVVEKVREITGGSVEKVIDAVGLPATRQQGIAMAESGGRVVFIGLHEDDTVIPGNVIVRKEIEIVGSFSYSDQNFAQGLSLIEKNAVVPDASWLHVRPLEEGKSSFDEQIDGSAQYPKIMLSV
nr:zinc-binding dehydrogenase [Alicyclobacillus fastidiosus]